ncbi:MAG: HAD-IC family P-type ATPase [Acidimicrobiia bacterium]
MPEPTRGLTAHEVAQRVADGKVNGEPARVGRSLGQIIRANLITRFNILLGALFAATLAVGAIKDTLFIVVVATNFGVGVFQEVRARRTLDKLAVLDAPTTQVIRNGTVMVIDTADVVLDDVISLSRGDQVPVDGVVIAQSGFEVDEALLTGEADAIMKPIDAQMLSGSVIVAGSGTMRATAVGDDAYARKLTAEAREFSLAGSELRQGSDTILRIITYVIVPVAALLFRSQWVSNEGFKEAVVGTVAGVAAMVPEGLVLLTSMAFSAGVVRLGRRKVLTRELASIEGLARVDVLFCDKTGTLTEPGMRVVAVESCDGTSTDDAEIALAALAHTDPKPNPTTQAIVVAYPTAPDWVLISAIAFNSDRRWSGAQFDGHGTWIIGAPEVLLDASGDTALAPQLDEHRRTGSRALILAHSDAALGSADVPTLPPDHHPVAVIALAEKVKTDVADTLAYFAKQGVAVKVLSGDNPTTVAAVAVRAGLGDATGIDAADLPTDPVELAAAVEAHQVIGRAGPDVKRTIVAAMQRAGHTVAMTGDGVNDLLALKKADVGIAMGEGSGATRSVAQFVLLDSGFSALPSVVGEGRRVIANIERVASLFLTKTTYAFVLALTVGIAHVPFPFLPRQLSVVGSLTVGIPGFLLALEPNDTRSSPGFVRRVLATAMPSGAVAAAATYGAYAYARADDASLAAARTTATTVLFTVAWWMLAEVARPWHRWRLAMLALMAVCFAGTLAIGPLRRYMEFENPSALTWVAAAAIATAGCVLVSAGQQWLKPKVMIWLKAHR